MENNFYERETESSCTEKVQKNWKRKQVAALALCCLVLGGAFGSGCYVLLYGQAQENPQEQDQPTSTVMEGVREKSVIQVSNIDTSKKLTPAEVYAANVNSTVGITTSATTNYWGIQTTAAASGSGFVITDDGYIVTNYHVIENSDSITVSLYDGTACTAELTGYDESNDIAVLKIDAEDLTPVVLGDSDDLNVGDDVVAIGNPLGELTFSLTSGSVSALDREVTFSNSMTMDLIQTDCAINSGNSGGALFNLYGEVVGVTNAKYSGSGTGASIDNIGFAIPINRVKKIVESIIEKGYISKPYIGVSVTDVSQETQSYGLPEGAAVKSIEEDGPAAEAGLEENDIITAVNGEEVKGSKELAAIVGDASPGDILVLTIYRKGENKEFKIIVGENVQSALKEKTAEETASQSDAKNRTIVVPWNSKLRERYGH